MHEDSKRFYLPATTINVQDRASINLPNTIQLSIKRTSAKNIKIIDTLVAHYNHNHAEIHATHDTYQCGKITNVPPITLFSVPTPFVNSIK